jgi:multidrug resistance efflux pump
MTMKRWLSVMIVAVCGVLASGLGYGLAAQQKKTIDQRVAELESKVTSLELRLRTAELELARTPRLGIQSAK